MFQTAATTSSDPAQIVPWLAHPPSLLLWGVLVISVLLAASAFIAIYRRSTAPCPPFPITFRTLSIVLVLLVSGLSAMAWGAELVNTVTVYAAPIFFLISLLITRVAWRADTDEQTTARTTLFSCSLATAAIPGTLLVAHALLQRATMGEEYDMSLGAGIGDAIGRFAPAFGAAALPLLFILQSLANPHARAARHALALHLALLLCTLGAVLAIVALAATVPLTDQSPLSDRYLWVGTLVAVPCVLAAAVLLPLAARAFASSIALLLAVPLSLVAVVYTLQSTLRPIPDHPMPSGLIWWHVAVILFAGSGFGVIATRWAPVSRWLRAATPFLLLILVCVLAWLLSRDVASPWMPALLIASAAIGFLTPLLLSRSLQGDTISIAQSVQTLSATGLTLLLAFSALLAAPLTLRSSLTWQAEAYSRSFKWNASRQTDPEMRTIIQSSLHGLSMNGSGTRWAWAAPQSTWWTRDAAWRDALVTPDLKQSGLSTPAPTGTYYRGRIIGPDLKLSDESFLEASGVGLIQPTPIGTRSAVVYTVTARKISPSDMVQWAKLSPANSFASLGFALGLLAGALLVLPSKLHTGVIGLAVVLVFASSLFGLAAGFCGLLGACVILVLVSAFGTSSDSLLPQRAWSSMALLAGLSLLLSPLTLALGA